METQGIDRHYSVDSKSTEHLLSYNEVLSKHFVNAGTDFKFVMHTQAEADPEVLDCVTCMLRNMVLRAPRDGGKGRELFVQFNAYLEDGNGTPVILRDHRLMVEYRIPGIPITFDAAPDNELLLGRFTKGLNISEIAAFTALRDELVESGFFLQRAGYVEPEEEDEDE